MGLESRNFSILGISVLAVLILGSTGFAFENAYAATINLNDSVSCSNIAGGAGFTWTTPDTCTLTNQPNTLVQFDTWIVDPGVTLVLDGGGSPFTMFTSGDSWLTNDGIIILKETIASGSLITNNGVFNIDSTGTLVSFTFNNTSTGTVNINGNLNNGFEVYSATLSNQNNININSGGTLEKGSVLGSFTIFNYDTINLNCGGTYDDTNLGAPTPNGITDLCASPAPAAPSKPDLDENDDFGILDSDDITSVATVDISGTAEADSTVELFDGVSSLGTTTATGGIWQFTPTLSEGVHSLTATATNGGGTGDPSDPLSIEIDLTFPSTPTINLAAASDSGSSDSDDITTTTTVTIDGNADTGTFVDLFEDAISLQDTTAAAGTYQFTETFAEGTHTLQAWSTDTAGNTSFSTILGLTVDTTAPDFTAPADVRFEQGDTVVLGNPTGVSDNFDLSPDESNDAPGTFPLGRTTVTWTLTDDAGNEAMETQDVVIAEVFIDTLTETNPRFDWAEFNVSGTVDGWESGETISLFAGTTEIASGLTILGVVDSTGTWSTTGIALDSSFIGAQTLTAQLIQNPTIATSEGVPFTVDPHTTSLSVTTSPVAAPWDKNSSIVVKLTDDEAVGSGTGNFGSDAKPIALTNAGGAGSLALTTSPENRSTDTTTHLDNSVVSTATEVIQAAGLGNVGTQTINVNSDLSSDALYESPSQTTTTVDIGKHATSLSVTTPPGDTTWDNDSSIVVKLTDDNAIPSGTGDIGTDSQAIVLSNAGVALGDFALQNIPPSIPTVLAGDGSDVSTATTTIQAAGLGNVGLQTIDITAPSVADANYEAPLLITDDIQINKHTTSLSVTATPAAGTWDNTSSLVATLTDTEAISTGSGNFGSDAKTIELSNNGVSLGDFALTTNPDNRSTLPGSHVDNSIVPTDTEIFQLAGLGNVGTQTIDVKALLDSDPNYISSSTTTTVQIDKHATSLSVDPAPTDTTWDNNSAMVVKLTDDNSIGALGTGDLDDVVKTIVLTNTGAGVGFDALTTSPTNLSTVPGDSVDGSDASTSILEEFQVAGLGNVGLQTINIDGDLALDSNYSIPTQITNDVQINQHATSLSVTSHVPDPLDSSVLFDHTFTMDVKLIDDNALTTGGGTGNLGTDAKTIQYTGPGVAGLQPIPTDVTTVDATTSDVSTTLEPVQAAGADKVGAAIPDGVEINAILDGEGGAPDDPNYASPTQIAEDIKIDPHQLALELDVIPIATQDSPVSFNGRVTDDDIVTADNLMAIVRDDTGDLSGITVGFTGSSFGGFNAVPTDLDPAVILTNGVSFVDSNAAFATINDRIVLEMEVNGEINLPAGTKGFNLLIEEFEADERLRVDITLDDDTIDIGRSFSGVVPDAEEGAAEPLVAGLFTGAISKVDIDESRGMKKIKITGFLQESFVDPENTISSHPTRDSISISSFETWDARYSPASLIISDFSDIDIADVIGAVPDPTNLARNLGAYNVIGTAPNVINTDPATAFGVTASLSGLPVFYIDNITDPTQSYGTDERTNFGVGNDIAVAFDAGTGITSSVCGGDYDSDGACDSWDQAHTGISYNAGGVTRLYPLDTSADEIDGFATINTPRVVGITGPDVWLEIDYMTEHRPSDEVIGRIVDSFNNAPLSGASRDLPGIHGGVKLHVIVDEQLDHVTPINMWEDSDTNFQNDFNAIKARHFGTPGERPTLNLFSPSDPQDNSYSNTSTISKEITVGGLSIETPGFNAIDENTRGTITYRQTVDFDTPVEISSASVGSAPSSAPYYTIPSISTVQWSPTGSTSQKTLTTTIEMFTVGPISSAKTIPDVTIDVTLVSGGSITDVNTAARSPVVKTTLLDAKAQVYHYMVIGHSLGGECGPSGLAEAPGNDVAIGLGCGWGQDDDNPHSVLIADSNNSYDPVKDQTNGDMADQAGTIMHELGHNLGLSHGSAIKNVDTGDLFPDANVNCRPTNVGVMTYAGQTDNFKVFDPVNAANNQFNLDYSRGLFSLFTLEEDEGLDETSLRALNNNPPPWIIWGHDGVGTGWSKQQAVTLSSVNPSAPSDVINWDADATSGELAQSGDINALPVGGCGDSFGQIHTDVSDWQHIDMNYRLAAGSSFDGSDDPFQDLHILQNDIIEGSKSAFSGTLQPLNQDGSSIFKAGKVVPFKVQVFSTPTLAELTDADPNNDDPVLLTDDDVHLFIETYHMSNGVEGTVVEPVASGAASGGDQFVFTGDSETGHHQYNLKTDKKGERGTWGASITAVEVGGDGSISVLKPTLFIDDGTVQAADLLVQIGPDLKELTVRFSLR